MKKKLRMHKKKPISIDDMLAERLDEKVFRPLIAILQTAPYCLSDNEILAILSHKGAKETVNRLIKTYLILTTLLTRSQILSIASTDNANKAIQGVIKNYTKLINLGWMQHEIVNIALKPGCARSMEKVIECSEKLMETGFTSAHIKSIASRKGGHIAIENILTYFNELNSSNGYDLELIARIGTCRGGGNKAIKIIIQEAVANAALNNKPAAVPIFDSVECITKEVNLPVNDNVPDYDLCFYDIEQLDSERQQESILPEVTGLKRARSVDLNEISSDLTLSPRIAKSMNSGLLTQGFFRSSQKLMSDYTAQDEAECALLSSFSCSLVCIDNLT